MDKEIMDKDNRCFDINEIKKFFENNNKHISIKKCFREGSSSSYNILYTFAVLKNGKNSFDTISIGGYQTYSNFCEYNRIEVTDKFFFYRITLEISFNKDNECNTTIGYKLGNSGCDERINIKSLDEVPNYLSTLTKIQSIIDSLVGI